MLNFLPEFLRSPVAFVIVLGVLVFIHELGHYLAARWCGVYVEAFSIGFGPAIVSWTDRVGTVWKLCCLPLGGYVKLHGQERPEDVDEATRASWQPGRTFHEKRVGARAFVVFAGPLANFVLAVVVFAALQATVGTWVPAPVPRAIVGDVIAGSPASKVGLREGDEIVAIDGVPIPLFQDLQHVIAAHPDIPLAMRVRRGDTELALTVTPTSRIDAAGQKIGLLGIGAGDGAFEQLGVLEAIPAGVVQTWDVGVETLDGVWEIITAKRGTEDLGGPLRIAQLSGQVAARGFTRVVTFIGLLSVNLGLINLFPVPVLDGGHLLFYLAEAVRGRPLPRRALEYGFRAGFAVLVMLFVFVTWNDLSHLGIFKWVAGRVG